MFACGGASVAPTPTPDPTSYYQVVTVSDLHFNPLYDPSLFAQLLAADSSQWKNIYQTSKVTAPSSAGTDTNYLLLTYTLTSLQQKAKNSPVVLFTGDLRGQCLQLAGGRNRKALQTGFRPLRVVLIVEKTIRFE